MSATHLQRFLKLMGQCLTVMMKCCPHQIYTTAIKELVKTLTRQELLLQTEIQASTRVAAQNDIIEDDEELLNEDDDDGLECGEDMNTQHLVLAQFDKVTRTKSRVEVQSERGDHTYNDKDILFNKAIGEFDF